MQGGAQFNSQAPYQDQQNYNNQGPYPNQQGFNNQGPYPNQQGFNNQGPYPNQQGFNNQGPYPNQQGPYPGQQGHENIVVNVQIQQPPMSYIPYPQMNIINMNNTNLVSEAVNILASSVSVFVKQEVNIMEMLTGCEQKNRYDVYVRLQNGQQLRMFRCKEESDFCMRICCQ